MMDDALIAGAIGAAWFVADFLVVAGWNFAKRRCQR